MDASEVSAADEPPEPEPAFGVDYSRPIPVTDTLPEGVDIRPTSYGQGLFVTGPHKAGDIIYTGKGLLIPDIRATYELALDNGRVYQLDSDTHSVKYSESERLLYLFDSFMNHSCNPSTKSVPVDGEMFGFHTVATRDMAAGDEITCDYNLFEYDCKGKEIEQCQCGAPGCIGVIRGFKFLSVEDKKARLSNIDESVMQWWAREDGKVTYYPEIVVPNSVTIQNTGGWCSEPEFLMVSNKTFLPGDTIFHRECQFVTDHELIVMKILNFRLWFSARHLIMREENKWEFFGFDSFQNHSCDPNTAMIYNSDKRSYCLRAIKPIAVGEELTSDYETFDENLDGVSFECRCDSTNCRGIIKA